MKRVLCAVLAVLMLVSLASCGEKPAEKPAATLKFGFGMEAVYGDVKSANGDANGSAEVEVTGAAVLLDKDGKIVKAVIDTDQNEAGYSSEGLASINFEFETKGEKGANYGMAAYGQDLNGDGVVKEWNEQIAIFASAVEGKTIDEVKAMVVNGYANTEVQTAGCTMAVADYVKALEKAVANAVESDATAADALQLGVVTSEEVTDATEEKEGSSEMEISFVAAVVREGKVVASSSDVMQVSFTFDINGAATTDTTVALVSKKDKGANYGMAAYGQDLNKDGVVKEWNEQAAAFDAALVGKTATEIAALVVNGYGVDSIQTAGCTMAISDMAAAAVKAATVA